MKTRDRCPRCNAHLPPLSGGNCPHCGEAVIPSQGGVAAGGDYLMLGTADGRSLVVVHDTVVGRAASGRELLEAFDGVSRRHARFSREEGGWFVTDLNSSNGTFLGGVRLAPNQPTSLAAGQVLALSHLFEATISLPAPVVPSHLSDATIVARVAPEEADAGKRPTLVIFFADIKGSVDFFQEMGTMVARNWIFKLFEMLTAILDRHHGQHLKNIGDAMLATFSDPCEAAQAAKEMQLVIQEHNKNAPESERYYLRIGMNIGRVLFENNDVFGNAVNIASRVQDLTPPGRIFVTRHFTDHIRGVADLRVRFIGQERLKGVRQPTDIFELLNETPAESKTPPRH